MSTAATSAVRRIPARELLAPSELALLRERVEWKGVALIAHAWAVILGSIALVAIFPNPLTYIVAVVLIGSRQLGLAILMHDGAHGCLVAQREAQHGAEPVVLRLSGVRRHGRLPALSPHPSRAHAAGGRSRPGALGAFPDHQGELSPQVLARYHRADRLRAAQGADSSTRSAIPHGRGGSACAISPKSSGRSSPPMRVLFAGLALAGVWWAYPLLWLRAAADLADGDHAHPQHRRACGGAGLRTIPCATRAPPRRT